MSFGTAIRTCFRKYATFSGRAPRSEYWWWVLFVMLGTMALAVLDSILFGTVRTGPGSISAQTDTPYLSGLFSLVTLLPGLAVTVRRLHDTDHSGWWIPALYALAFVGSFSMMAGLVIIGWTALAGMVTVFVLLLIWLISRGTPGPNRFGADPLGGGGGADGSDGQAGNPVPVPTVRRG